MHFGNGVVAILWQATDGVLYVQLMLAYHRCPACGEQFVVVKQRACYGVLDGEHSYNRWVSLDILEHSLESGAADKLYLLSLKELVGGDVMERSDKSLYSYSFHILLLVLSLCGLTKNGPALLQAGPFRILSFLSQVEIYTQLPALQFLAK